MRVSTASRFMVPLFWIAMVGLVVYLVIRIKMIMTNGASRLEIMLLGVLIFAWIAVLCLFHKIGKGTVR